MSHQLFTHIWILVGTDDDLVRNSERKKNLKNYETEGQNTILGCLFIYFSEMPEMGKLLGLQWGWRLEKVWKISLKNCPMPTHLVPIFFQLRLTEAELEQLENLLKYQKKNIISAWFKWLCTISLVVLLQMEVWLKSNFEIQLS